MRPIVKALVIGTFGLAVLVGWSALSGAKPIKSGVGYCDCVCAMPTGETYEDIFRGSGSACRKNGARCKFKKGEQTYVGFYQNCQKCTGDASGGLQNCTAALVAPPKPPKQPGLPPGAATPPPGATPDVKGETGGQTK